MNQHMHELLLRLDRANLDDSSEWVSRLAIDDIPRHTRQYAQSRGWMIGRGSKRERQYKITAEGKTKLAENADANMAVMDKLEKGFVPTADESPIEFAGLDGVIKPGFKPEPGIVRGLTPRNLAAPHHLIQVTERSAQKKTTAQR